MRTMPKPKKYSDAFARLVAGFSGADVRTVRRFLAGQPVKGAGLRERLEQAKTQAMANLAAADMPSKPVKARRSR